jgi:hypothetical protein
MQRTILVFAFFNLLALGCLQAQSLTDFNTQRYQKQRTSMMILGGWAVGNIAIGTALASQRQGESRYFHGMNAGWNLVNLGLAAAGYFGASPEGLDLYSSIQAQYKLQKIFLFNAGLDVGYMAGGLYLIERARRTEDNPERLRGFGKAIILQGAFLFVFDLGAYLWQAQSNADIQPLLQGLSFDGQSLGFRWRF